MEASQSYAERVMNRFREKQLARQTQVQSEPIVHDTFFSQTHCDRCGAELKGRMQSWFTKETICIDKCVKEETELRAKLPKIEGNFDYEGCGYIPTV